MVLPAGAVAHVPDGLDLVDAASLPLTARQALDLLGLAAEGTLELRVAGRVPLRDAAKAFEKVAGGGQRGRWLLIP
jgi:D-arabinose 1-dehydrogenase-like Zn-dependent alcohol dehydrogenase